MKVQSTGPTELELSEVGVAEVRLAPSFGAVELLAASLAVCTGAVLKVHAENVVKLPLDNVRVRVGWTTEERPLRVAAFELDILWPELPEARRDSVRRAALTCTVHRTLEHSPEITTRVSALLRE